MQSNMRPSTRLSFASNPITNRAEGEAFIFSLIGSNLLFHFEDNPLDVVNDLSGTFTFTMREALTLAKRVRELYALDWDKWDCPLGFALHVIGHTDQ